MRFLSKELLKKKKSEIPTNTNHYLTVDSDCSAVGGAGEMTVLLSFLVLLGPGSLLATQE